MEKIQALKNAIEFAKQNPDDPQSFELRKRIESGVYNNELNQIKLQAKVEQHKSEMPQEETGLAGFATGVGKGILSTVKGAGQLGEKIGNAILSPFGKSVEQPSVWSEDALQSEGKNTAKGDISMGKLFRNQNLETQGTAEGLGKFAEQVGEFAIPGSKVAKLGEGAGLVRKVASRALGSGTVGAIQEGKIGTNAGLAAGTEVALPVLGKVISPVAKVFGRLLKGTGSILSGASTDMLDTVARNPQVAEQTVKKINQQGLTSVLEDNAKTIVNGVSTIRQQARKMFGDGLESLAKTDIKPEVVQSELQSVLSKNGIEIPRDEMGHINGAFDFNNSEILDGQIQKRASNLLEKVNALPMTNGKDLRTAMDVLEASKLKSSLDPNRQAYNGLVDDMISGLRNAVNKSTDKLKEINAKYTADLGLTGAIEKIFGNVNFKNPAELNAVSQKLEGLFNQKGLSPQYVDDFLNRLGIKPEEFKTSESVRQMSTKKMGTNTIGASFGEMTRNITGAGITPKMIRDIAIKVGKSEAVVKKLIENTAPSGRALLIETLISANK
jgi:hypothetical protein